MSSDPVLRRDFLNNVLLGAGAGLLGMAAPALAADRYTGYAGVGDYARSNGDPWPVVAAGHRMRDRGSRPAEHVQDTGERFDVIVLGAGLSGLGTAYYYRKATGGSRRCLVLENHAIFGGHCKQNEFLVVGQFDFSNDRSAVSSSFARS